MIPEQVINKLLTLETMQALLEVIATKGYKNPIVFKPVMESQANKLHFLVTPSRNDLTDFDQASLTRRIKEILQTDNIIVEDEQDYNPEDRSMVIGKACPLTGIPLETIAKFCHDELVFKPKMDTRFEDNKMIAQVEMPEKELSDEEKEQYIHAVANQVVTDLRSKLFPASSHNLGLKSSA